jgi:hypothetical protein
MRASSSVKLVAATWIAALLGALAGRSLAEASATTMDHTRATVATGVQAR